jgi:hypothetical protein
MLRKKVLVKSSFQKIIYDILRQRFRFLCMIFSKLPRTVTISEVFMLKEWLGMPIEKMDSLHARYGDLKMTRTALQR